MVVGSSLTETENLAEDIAKLVEIQDEGVNKSLEFHLLEQDPAESHPDFFEKNCNKLSLLSSLMSLKSYSSKRLIIAATPETLLSACTPRENKESKELSISCGAEINFEAFQEKLSRDLDYSSEILCEEPGQYSLRGGLIDVYPVNASIPYRIDFFGNEVDEIRSFDPTTQRTIEAVQKITLSSAHLVDDHSMEGAFFSYITCDTTWAFIEPEKLIADYPLAFHQSEKEKFKKVCMELAWTNPTGRIPTLASVKSTMELAYWKI